MTRYFDEKNSQYQACLKSTDPHEAVMNFELELVKEITIVTELGKFPEFIRNFIHQKIAQYGVATKPTKYHRRDAEESDEIRSVGDMIEALHGAFHMLMKEPGDFSDDPMAVLNAAEASGQEYRDELFEAGRVKLTWE